MGSLSTNTFSSLDSDGFTNDCKMVIDFIADYYKNIENYPVQSQVKPGYLLTKLPDTAPYCQESLEDVLKDVTDSIIPGLTHWQSPNFFAYFQSNASTAGFVGEMLCSGLNVVGFSWIASPAATELESIVMDWMGKMLKLPSTFLFSGNGGYSLHPSCSKRQTEKSMNISKLVVYASDQTHSALFKGVKLVGIPSSNFRCLSTSFSSEFSLSPQSLEDAIENDIKAGYVPLFLCATVGTTACGAVDPVMDLGKIARKYNLWFHIDAAYAAASFINRVTVKQSRILEEQCEAVVDYKDWQIALSRRFRALKLWIVIRMHGIANLMFHIRSHVNLAKRFESLVAKDSRFEVVVPRRFSLVCFRLKHNDACKASELNRKLLAAVNESGRAFMTHSVVGGLFIIRCAVGSTLIEERHVDDLWKLIQEKAADLVEETGAIGE
uniref:Tyrosine decarboxylase n=1 Tax=Salix viminalis TaxID=40686 RepID=A0A6N2MCN5_SALVM